MMDNAALVAILGWAFCFILGMGLMLRPGVILGSMVFKPTFHVLVVLIVVGAMILLRDPTSQNTLALGVGVGAAILGGGLGCALKRFENRRGR